MREEQRRRAEERQANEIQKHAKTRLCRCLGCRAPVSDGAGANVQKSQPIEMFQWVSQKLRGDSDSDTSRRHRKEAKNYIQQ